MSWWYDQLAQILEKNTIVFYFIITQFTLDTFMIQFVCRSLPYLKRSSWFLIVHKGKYEVALGVMRVERRKFLLFLPDFGAISYFSMGDLLWQSIKRGSIENWLPMRRIVRLFQSLMGGGGGGNVKFIMTQPKCVIRSEFFTSEIFTSRRKKKSLCWEV